MKVVHVITSLDRGGAEAVLYRLATAPFDGATEHVVVSLQGLGTYGPLLIERNVATYTLDMPKGKVSMAGIWRLFRIMRRLRPDVVQTWMYHSDLIGGVVARLAGVKRIVWGVRHANLDKDKNSRMTLLVARLCARLSKFVPSSIVCCSERAAVTHKAFGYSAGKFVNIPNGYDISRFKPDAHARSRVRAELGIGEDAVVLGCVARWDIQKDHPNLLGALSLLKQAGFDGRCLLAGAGINSENSALTDLIDRFGLASQVHLLDQRDDVPDLMNAFDINVLSSSGEAFPNVLAEAMACGVPSVTTDVGDARLIVGDTGWVVEAENVTALADGITRAIAELSSGQGAERAQRCRRRIVDEFQLSKMVSRFETAWSSAGKHPLPATPAKIKSAASKRARETGHAA
jgi:glycosyltransferase involved in cell wall biosynthesis